MKCFVILEYKRIQNTTNLNRIIYILILILNTSAIANAQKCEGPLSVTMVGASTNFPITIDEEASGIYCTESNEGTINITVYGGTPEYDYKWAHADANGSFLDDLPVGSYHVTVTDAKGCREERTITIVNIDPLADSLDLIDYSACGYCYMNDGTQSFFYFEEEYIGSVVDLKTDKDLGGTMMCTDITDVTYRCQGDPVLRRKWEVETDSMERMNVRLFFSEEELNYLAIAAGYPNVIQLVNSNSLYVNKFEIGKDDCAIDFPMYLHAGDFTVTKFDEEKKVWSIELVDCDDASILLLARGSVLPVDLLAFSGEALSKINRLYWSTANELNNRGFFVEKSKNGLQFESIGFVESKDKAEADYIFDDNNPWNGSNYYKLNQVDLDGESKYSHIIHLVRHADFEFKVVENPFRHTLYIVIDSNTDIDGNISIFAINGQIVYEKDHNVKTGSTELQFDMNIINSGNYIIRFLNKANNTYLTKKIVKI